MTGWIQISTKEWVSSRFIREITIDKNKEEKKITLHLVFSKSEKKGFAPVIFEAPFEGEGEIEMKIFEKMTQTTVNLLAQGQNISQSKLHKDFQRNIEHRPPPAN